MKTPTENGYYWVRFKFAPKEWELVRLNVGWEAVFRTGQDCQVYNSKVLEWGERIEHTPTNKITGVEVFIPDEEK